MANAQVELEQVEVKGRWWWGRREKKREGEKKSESVLTNLLEESVASNLVFLFLIAI